MFKTTLVAVLASLTLIACGQKPAEEVAPVEAAPAAPEAAVEAAPAADAVAAPATAETAPVNAQ